MRSYSLDSSWKRRSLIAPAIEREIRNDLTEKAEDGAISVFGQNLEQLLMQPPIAGKVVLGWDPAFRTGCKLAVVDETGKVLDTKVISVKGVGADFHESLFKEVRMEDSVFSYANFSGTSWESAVLNGCDLQESYLEECRLKKTELNRVKLNRANLFGTALRGLDLRGCEIEGILISDEKKELAGAVVDLYQAAELARLMGLVIR